jgi:class 3 adenylate cyclase
MTQSPQMVGCVLFVDIVGSSLRSNTELNRMVKVLTRLVRKTPTFARVQPSLDVVRKSTGDGLLVVFREYLDPVHCATELARGLTDDGTVPVRMGVNIGPITPHEDISGDANALGGGMVVAARVMDCGDQGHVLLSGPAADQLDQLDPGWVTSLDGGRAILDDLGRTRVKSQVVHVHNLYSESFGNPSTPRKLHETVFSDKGTPLSIGIQTFHRGAETLDSETDDTLCLLRHFDGRHVRDSSLWAVSILPEVERFLFDARQRASQLQLRLEAHASIAFAAGYFLDTRTGVQAVPMQSTQAGRQLWRVDGSMTCADYPSARFEEHRVGTDGTDVALAISLAQPVVSDVLTYVTEALPRVGRVLECVLPGGPGPGPGRVVDGTHAQLLVQQITKHLRSDRTREERQGRLHLFAAAPNGLLFFLGQLGRGLGPCTLYEYDFEGNAQGAYTPSITFPTDLHPR